LKTLHTLDLTSCPHLERLNETGVLAMDTNSNRLTSTSMIPSSISANTTSEKTPDSLINII